MKTEAKKKKLGLYIHIPFCVQKCFYCDFCSFAGASEQISEYVERICADIQNWSLRCGGLDVDTVYFGGGTPTLLSASDFYRITDCINKYYSVCDSAEISCECNPATADLEYLRKIRSSGINRLSIGLQSSHDNELARLGRIHGFSDFLKTYEDSRLAGFENVSVDLMYGIPEQTLVSFAETLERIVSLDPEHISAYGLKIEEGTPFGKMKASLVLPNEDAEYDMYMKLTHFLAENGYTKYEISNFSHLGYESRHNMRYWKGEDYLGFGVSAHSYFEGERLANSRDIGAYLLGEDITESKREIGESERETEFVMLRMRMSEGVNKQEFADSFKKDFDSCYGKALKKYINAGFVADNGYNTFFTDKGFFVSNYILSDILDFD